MGEMTTANGTGASPLCFGCMQFGGTADEAASRAMFEACRRAGVNTFDTAHTYTGGSSERLLGAFIGQDRDDVVVATKVAYSGGSGRGNILKQFDESRARLGMDCIDLLYLHRWDGETPIEESIGALRELQETGKIRQIGVSNFAAWQVMKAQAIAMSLGTRIDVLQPMYSLVKRQAEVELFPMAESEGFAVMPYSPLGGGLLTGKYLDGGEGRLSTDTRYAARYAPFWMAETVRGLRDLSEDLGLPPATLAVAWAASHPAVTAPIISARNADQLKPSLDALSVSLDADLRARISALSPRPAPATDRLEEELP